LIEAALRGFVDGKAEGFGTATITTAFFRYNGPRIERC
jgi:hypothetical protein